MYIPAQGERFLARQMEENDKKSQWSLAQSEREKSLKTFEKGELNKLRSDFKKTYSRFSIDRESVSID